MLLTNPSMSSTQIPVHQRKNSLSHSPIIFPVKSMATADNIKRSARRTAPMSAVESRVSLVLALAAQTSSLSQRFLMELANETAKYVFPSRRFESRSLEESLMSVPDLETVEFKVLSRNDQYEIREEVESYYIAETTMPGKYGFDFAGASQSFNVLAEYLFGKNTREKQMEMTTPVFTRRIKSNGEKMDMTTPVITRRVEDQDKWNMSFVMPSKYGANLPLPKDSSVTIKEVPKRIIAVVAFSDYGTFHFHTKKGRGMEERGLELFVLMEYNHSLDFLLH
ncbi:Heme-binding-like protein, chloroplastic [Sesamum angolense]|uniref:Heme-binding-like protein, chloroplastic n=1 Tax=Sesamum angolense TaxID=2727404 RepID=A0AAE1WF06_9LAMI|nr:Heme-binding-like protein, chloroplastic [Sesamum angolense]